ncbi:MAG: helix-turn-helix transcriptional regulator [Thermoplasmata archaeon]
MSAMDSGTLEGTRGRILEELATAPRTARDLAQKLGIQESAARGHLGRMEEKGLVVPSFRREGVGRPRKRYVLTGQGQDLFPKKYDLILDAVVDELLAREGEGFVSALFAESARRMAGAIAKEIPKGATADDKARRLVAALNDLGFRCTLEKTADGHLRVVRSNCIFRHSALAHPYLLCDVFDKNLTEALLGEVGVDLEDSIGRGGMRCTHLIQLR